MNLLITFIIMTGYGGQVMVTRSEDIVNSYNEALKDLKKLEDLSAYIEQSQPKKKNKSSESGNRILSLLSKTKDLEDKFKKVYTEGTKVFGEGSKAQPEEKVKEKDETVEKIALVKGVGNGLVKVITGIKDKDWLKVVSGGLNVIASILVYTGPIGSFIGAILSLISTGLCAFGSKKVKSQTELILEGVNQALDKFRDDKIAATTLYYLRDIQQAEAKIDAVLKSPKISDNELISLVNDMEKLFLIQDQGGIALVHLELIIKENCAIASSCNRCLLKIQEYLMLSMQRQIFALRVLGLYPKLENEGSEINQISYEGSLERVAQMRKIDIKWLDYFLKPMTSNVAKTCVANYYQFPGDYPFIDAYMKMLLENQNVNDAGLHLIASTKEDLKGKLVVIYTKSYKYVPADKSGEVYSWLKELKSLFIPPKYQASLHAHKKEKVYLFKGPTVVNLKDDFYYFSMSQNQKLTGEYIRGCYDRQMAGPCVQIDPTDTNPPSISQYFQPQSLYIPPGKQASIAVYPNNYDTYHNIRGPLTLGYICTPGTKISALTFQDAEFPKNIIKICTDKNFDGWCDYIDDKVKKTNIIHGCEWKNIGSYNIPASMILETNVKINWGLKEMVEDRYGPEVSVIDTNLNDIIDISVSKTP